MNGWLLIPTALAAPVAAAPVESGSLADGSVSTYVASALEESPDVHAAFARYEAAVHRVARARALPEPVVTFGVFVRSVETRVGPQQARISVQQAFPWPTKLIAGGQAGNAEAAAAQSVLEATSLMVAQRVEGAYWTLWEVRATRALHQEHLEVITGLGQTVRSRLEIGKAILADVQQVDLTRARLEDAIRSMDEREGAAEAQLAAALGLQNHGGLLTTTEPSLARVSGESELSAAVAEHPRVEAWQHRADAAEARARAANANRMPGFTVSGDWVVTGLAAMDTPDNGKDAVMAGVGLKVPLWQGTYSHEIGMERSMANASRAEQQAAADRAVATLEVTLSQVRDSERRVTVLSATLLPQARGAYASILGGYTVGQSSVAQTLLSQRDLLDLGVDLAKANADHQRAWAQLDQLVGREVPRTPATDLETP